MIKKTNPDLFSGLLSIFPDQIKVYPVGSLKNFVSASSPSLLHKHFREPLSQTTWEKLAFEIAGFLNDKGDQEVYSFFYRCVKNGCSEADWFLSCARLNKTDKGNSKEVVIFTYDLGLLGESKNRLYTVLENDGFFRENFNRVALLTKREKEIVRLLSAGMSSPKIAELVHISVHTVNTHRKNINDKLAIQNFATLLKFADVFDLTTTDIAI
jgi:DNA-binding CsgD family transcriptional regulator